MKKDHSVIQSLREFLFRAQMPPLEEAANVCQPLLSRFYRETATVTDRQKGYISFPPANQVFPGEIAAATGIVGLSFLGQFIEEPIPLVAIPDSGRYWVSTVNALAAFWGISTHLISSRSDGRLPGAWNNPVMVQPQTSFTTGRTEKSFAIHPAIREWKSVVVVDDYCASGDMATVFIGALRKAGVEVAGFMTLVEKAFQGGIRKVHEATGVSAAAVLSVEGIDGKNGIKLANGASWAR